MTRPAAGERELREQMKQFIRSGDVAQALETCRRIAELAEGIKNPRRRALRLYQRLYEDVHGEPAPHAHVFDHIYSQKLWGEGSGGGSAPEHTAAYREFLQQFIGEHGIRSIVDAGCGDWHLMRLMDLSGIGYLGIDVSAVVLEATRRHARDGVQFAEGDARNMQLPSADLLLMKDVLQHWSADDILGFVPQLARFRVCLITNDLDLARPDNINKDIMAGGYRSLDLTAAPFRLPGRHVFSFMADKPKSVLLVRGGEIRALLWARIFVRRLLSRMQARLRGRARP